MTEPTDPITDPEPVTGTRRWTDSNGRVRWQPVADGHGQSSTNKWMSWAVEFQADPRLYRSRRRAERVARRRVRRLSKTTWAPGHVDRTRT